MRFLRLINREQFAISGKLFGFFITAIALLSGLMAEAQPNADLVPLFARSNISGTGRSASMAGAFGSVGADLSCLDINPAGLGLYRSSDVCVTPAARIAQNTGLYDGTSSKGVRPSFEIAQAGFAFTKMFGNSTNHGDMGFDSHPLRSITFAINLQRDAYFSRTQNFNQASTPNSLINTYASVATGVGNPFFTYESVLMYYAGMLNNNANSGNYYSRVYGPVQQIGNIITRGGIDKISLGLGGNISDKVYFGFGLAVPILNYTTTPQMTENELTGDTGVNFPSYNMSSTINESGVGITGNLGIIYKPVKWAKFGIAYALPTWYFLSETYSSSISLIEDSTGGPYQGTISTDDFQTPPPVINYRLRTPMRGTVSASFFLKEMGFISIDYEFQNVGSTRYRYPDTTYVPAYFDTLYNNYIKSTYAFIHTVRVGIEGAVKVVRLHAGYSYSSSPFRAGQAFTPGYDGAVQCATAGVGVRLKNFYFDLAYAFSFTKDALQGKNDSFWGFQLYYDQVNNRYMTHTISLTFGWKISKDNSSASKKRRAPAPVNNYTPPPASDPGDRY
jgi:hypothetical protein